MLNSAAGVKLPSAIEPPHQHGACDPFGAVGIEVTGDVRERSGGNQRDGRCGAAHALGDERGRASRHGFSRSRRQSRAVDPALTVDVRRNHEITPKRPVGAGRDLYIRPPHELQYPQRVCCGLLKRLVPVRRRDAEHLDLRARQRKEERDRVVVPRVAIEDDRDGGSHAAYCRASLSLILVHGHDS